ncbi:hypothetical protein A2W24_04935 [Microgenomates group bacterium RBG_16_45_19]|nr:MAG: hypothetical protein A2W24_04935 [Microgenomates group bacterium RBG_16_45_19]
MAKKILVVEDHPSVRTMLVSLFRNHGYEVTEAHDGHDGLALLRQGGFDAVLLDLKLPTIDGFSILKLLHEQPPKNPNGPIIVFSNTGDESAKQQSLEFGAASFVHKENLDTLKLVEQVEATMAHKVPTSTTNPFTQA